jgi:acyl-CoA synthetase (NDP forming)
MSEISIDVNEITGPMRLKREELLTEAAKDRQDAETAREGARLVAEKELQAGEEMAEGFERNATLKEAYAARWGQIMAREETEAGVTVKAIGIEKDEATAEKCAKRLADGAS